MKNHYPMEFVVFLDDTFILFPDWVAEFSEEYPRRIGLPFFCNVRANLVNEDIARQLNLAGCVSVGMGLETGNDELRERVLNRNMTRETIVEACHTLRNAGITTDQVDYINAHGTSTPLNDAGETLAVKNVFGERAYQIPISSTKSMVGHSMGAAGAFEAVACLMTLRDQKIHPTVNYETPDPVCDLDYVPNQARNATVNVTMSNSFGLGGQNACLIMAQYK